MEEGQFRTIREFVDYWHDNSKRKFENIVVNKLRCYESSFLYKDTEQCLQFS